MHGEETKNNLVHAYKNGNKSHVSGKSILTIARCIIKDPLVPHKQLQKIANVKATSVTYALKKIKEKISNCQLLLGLSEQEMEQLEAAMTDRANGGSWGSGELYCQLTTDVENRVLAGQSIDEISSTLDIDEKKIKSIISKTKDALIQKMFHEGYMVSDIAEQLNLKKSEINNSLSKNKAVITEILSTITDNTFDINKLTSETGFDRDKLIKGLKKSGYSLKNIAGKMAEKKESYWNIARRLGVTESEAIKLLGIKVRKIKTGAKAATDTGKHISMMTPSKPNTGRIYKKPPSISPKGLAEWCITHYDPKTGKLILPCAAPVDLPKTLPKTKIGFIPTGDRSPEIIAAPYPSKSECSERGRRRIGVMHFN